MLSKFSLMMRLLLSFIAIVGGVALLIGGGWLAWIGGSPCYALGGSALLAIGVLLLRASRWVYWASALLNLVTLGWAVSEVGLGLGGNLAPGSTLVAVFKRGAR